MMIHRVSVQLWIMTGWSLLVWPNLSTNQEDDETEGSREEMLVYNRINAACKTNQMGEAVDEVAILTSRVNSKTATWFGRSALRTKYTHGRGVKTALINKLGDFQQWNIHWNGESFSIRTKLKHFPCRLKRIQYACSAFNTSSDASFISLFSCVPFTENTTAFRDNERVPLFQLSR